MASTLVILLICFVAGTFAQGCPRNKTCRCDNVIKYTTGNQPNTDLSSFPGLSLSDGPTARSYVQTYTRMYIDDKIKEAKCDNNKLRAVDMDLNPIVMSLKTMNTNYVDKKTEMQDIIDCNPNLDIESDLWDVYDVLADHCVCISQIHKDLKMKMEMVEAEMKRCDERGWYRSMLESFSIMS